ncbi:MAG TPA: hypothetical protein VGJ78_26945 [Vicinamibacterales bacterium]
MHKWIAGSACAAAVLSLAVASAQTYPQTSDQQPATNDQQPATKSAPSNPSGERSSSSTGAAAQRVTVTGCLTRGTDARTESWMLSNATMASGATAAPTASGTTAAPTSGRVSENSATANESTAGTSRSGSPSNEGTSAGNREATTDIGVSGSTSTAVGTSGTNNPTARPDTEAHGAGILGATDQKGGTVGAGATAGVKEESPTPASGDQKSRNTGGNVSYQLMDVRNPAQYVNKRVEVVGTMSTAGNASNRTLRVTSVRVLGDTCQ